MRRSLILLAVIGMLSAPLAVAHPPSGTDTNTLVFNQVWPLMGRNGPVDNALGNNNFGITPFGGVLSASTTHHAQATHSLTGYQCGDPGVTLTTDIPFFHSSLSNGIFEATGSFFVDLDATGPKANQIDSLWFGFIHSFVWPASAAACAGPFPLPGAYYEFYRGDSDGSDGWEIPVNTLLVPDMAYGAVLRALDANGLVLKSVFVYANVNNYLDDTEWQPGTPTVCDQDPNNPTGFLCPYHDVTPPFPHVEGALGHARTGLAAASCGNGIAFEYGEPLKSFSASSGTVTQFGYVRDNPGTPAQEPLSDGRDVDPFLLVTVTSEAWGPSYCVTGATRPLTVTALDQSDNEGVFTVT